MQNENDQGRRYILVIGQEVDKRAVKCINAAGSIFFLALGIGLGFV